MARPKSNNPRSNRITTYWTKEEQETINTVADFAKVDVSKFIVESVMSRINTMENPPEPIAKAKYENIMQETSAGLKGYVCSNGHSFWVDDSFSFVPHCCPCCGVKSFKSAWYGKIKRGF